MFTKQLNACPQCGGEIQIRASSGGRRGELTDYAAHCTCGFEFGCLGSDGTKRSAIRQWNALSKEKVLEILQRVALLPRRTF